MPSRDSVLADVLPVMRDQIGVHESPRGSNKTKYGKRYGWNGVAWCVIFAWWLVAAVAGIAAKYFPKTASVANLRSWARAHGRWSSKPRVLDVGLYPFGVSHAVVVEKFVSGGKVQCVGGNSNKAGARDADTVVRKIYPISCFSGFVVVPWAYATKLGGGKTKPTPAPKPSIARVLKLRRPYMRGADVKRVQRKVGSTPDGAFGPNTDTRVKRFQRSHKLKVDGDVGPKTARALGFVWKG